MMRYIYKYLGIAPRVDAQSVEKDDFSEFFYDAKSAKRAKIIREVMREATAEQKAVIKRYKEKQLV